MLRLKKERLAGSVPRLIKISRRPIDDKHHAFVAYQRFRTRLLVSLWSSGFALEYFSPAQREEEIFVETKVNLDLYRKLFAIRELLRAIAFRRY